MKNIITWNYTDFYTYGDFSKFIDEKISLKEFIKYEKVMYSKINFVRADISNFNDLSIQDINEYEKLRGLDYNSIGRKIDFFAELC